MFGLTDSLIKKHSLFLTFQYDKPLQTVAAVRFAVRRSVSGEILVRTEIPGGEWGLVIDGRATENSSASGSP